MNLFIQECKMSIKSLCLWCLGVLLFIGIAVAKNTGISGEASQDMAHIISQMPKSLQSIFGLGVIDLSKSIGIFSILLLYIALIFAFHASSIGVSCFSKEERDKTFEFLYVKGMTRFSILGIKIIVGLIQILILNIATYILSVVMVSSISHDDISKDFLPMMIGMFFLQLLFFSIGLLLSFLTKEQKKASGISFGVIMACFIISMVSDINSNAEFLKYITPFKYFDGKDILINGLSPMYIIICLVLSTLFIGYSFNLHNKRDLQC